MQSDHCAAVSDRIDKETRCGTSTLGEPDVPPSSLITYVKLAMAAAPYIIADDGY